MISSGSSFCLRSSYGLYTGPGGGAAFYVAGDGAYSVSPALAPAAIWDGRWHRLAATYDGAAVRLYLDGAQVGDGTPGPTHIEYLRNRGAYIGTYLGTCALPFVGDIDAPAIWNEALPAGRLGRGRHARIGRAALRAGRPVAGCPAGRRGGRPPRARRSPRSPVRRSG